MLRERGSFNSLFEMLQCGGALVETTQQVALSILYLRCCAVTDTDLICLSLASFNSLFEMPGTAVLVRPLIVRTFNSLFEMRVFRMPVPAPAARALSILYLRCPSP